MSKRSSWQPIIDKVKKRLSSWKAKTLSFGGRLCLCKAVLGSLSTFYFSLYRAPKKVLLTLESLRRRFFWGEKEGSKCINWVAWNKTLGSKKNRGLGIGSLEALNIAMLGKWWWRERTEATAIWKEVIRKCCGGNTRYSGGVWKGIKGIGAHLSELGINLDNLLQQNNHGWVWSIDPSNTYIVGSLRKLIDRALLPQPDHETYWLKWVPSKVNIHVWSTLRYRLATLDNLTNRGVELSSLVCRSCNAVSESVDHVIVECSSARLVSANLWRWVEWWPINCRSVSDFWESIDRNNANVISRDVKRMIAAGFLWILWRQRNEKVFGRASKNEKAMSEEIRSVTFDWFEYRSKCGYPLY